MSLNNLVHLATRLSILGLKKASLEVRMLLKLRLSNFDVALVRLKFSASPALTYFATQLSRLD